MFDGIQFFKDYNIHYEEEGKNIGAEWVGIKCPACDDPSTHLGFCPGTGAFSCWRCKTKSKPLIIKSLLNVSWREAYKIIEQYSTKTPKKQRQKFRKEKKEKDINVEFPAGTLDYFPKKHRKYLENRGFDPEYLIEKYNLKATGPLGKYNSRIIIPIYHNGVMVSYTGRSIIDCNKRYKSCDKELERRNPHDCLYGLEHIVGKNCIVVEGVFDRWNIEHNSVALMGTGYTDIQVNLLYDSFEKLYILFDPEFYAQRIAEQLTAELCALGKEAINISLDIDSDPGDMTNKEKQFLLEELLI